MIRTGSLFSGGGMLDVAVHQVLGVEPVWFAESDPAASKVLAHHRRGGLMTASRADERCGWPRCPDPTETRGHCQRHYSQLHHLGRMPSTLIDPTQVRARIQIQVDRGRTYHSLSRLSGIDDKAIERIHLGHTRMVRVSTARRILAVPLRATPIGCVRRIQALARLGHTRAVIAHHADCSPGCLKTILYRRCPPAVTSPLADGLSVAYAALSGTWGPSRQVASLAASNGYLPPWCWDGLDIDDPAATPDPASAIRGPRGPHPRVSSAAYVAARTGLDIHALEQVREIRRAAS